MKRLVKLFLNSAIIGSILVCNISSVFASQVVKVSIGNTIASVNGNDTTLSIAPYIQQPSDSMMIPLRFVSTGLGIDESDIQYNANTKEITITYNGATAKFIVGTNKLVLNGEEFSMLIENKYPVYTEIKNGSTFIPLRSLELAFGVKIDWEASTKTAILTNENEVEKIEEITEQVIPTQPIENEQVEPYEKNQNNSDEIIFLNLINEEREKQGLQPVEISDKLMETAKKKRIDMEEREYFSHTDPDGYNMAIDLGISENCSTVSGVENAFNSWLSSTKGHKEIMLDPNIKYIGISTYGCSVLHLSSDDKWAN